MSPREKTLAVGAGVAVFLWALHAFLLRPLADWQEAITGRVSILASRVARGEALIAQSALWRHRATKTTTTEIASANWLMKEVDRIARSTGVRIKDLRPEASKKEIQVAVITESPWGPISRFGWQLSRESDALRIEKVEIQRLGEQAEALRGRFVITLKDGDK